METYELNKALLVTVSEANKTYYYDCVMTIFKENREKSDKIIVVMQLGPWKKKTKISKGKE